MSKAWEKAFRTLGKAILHATFYTLALWGLLTVFNSEPAFMQHHSTETYFWIWLIYGLGYMQGFGEK